MRVFYARTYFEFRRLDKIKLVFYFDFLNVKESNVRPKTGNEDLERK